MYVCIVYVCSMFMYQCAYIHMCMGVNICLYTCIYSYHNFLNKYGCTWCISLHTYLCMHQYVCSIYVCTFVYTKYVLRIQVDYVCSAFLYIHFLPMYYVILIHVVCMYVSMTVLYDAYVNVCVRSYLRVYIWCICVCLYEYLLHNVYIHVYAHIYLQCV